MSAFLQVLWLLTVLVGGIFLLLPKLTSDLSAVRLWKKHNVTVGRLSGLVISVTSIILLYRTFT